MKITRVTLGNAQALAKLPIEIKSSLVHAPSTITQIIVVYKYDQEFKNKKAFIVGDAKRGILYRFNDEGLEIDEAKYFANIIAEELDVPIYSTREGELKSGPKPRVTASGVLDRFCVLHDYPYINPETKEIIYAYDEKYETTI